MRQPASYLPHTADDTARDKHVLHDVGLLSVPRLVVGKGREEKKVEISHALNHGRKSAHGPFASGADPPTGDFALLEA